MQIVFITARLLSLSHSLLLDDKSALSESHALLDLSNRQRRVETLGARPRAVKDGVASVQAHAVIKGVLALRLLLITRVGDPAVRLKEDSGSEVLLLVPPIRRARCRTAGAENTFVETVELLAVLLSLAVFAALSGISKDLVEE